MASSTFTTVTGLTPGTSYYYRVAAINKAGGLSNFAGMIISGYTLPPPPSYSTATVLGVSLPVLKSRVRNLLFPPMSSRMAKQLPHRPAGLAR